MSDKDKNQNEEQNIALDLSFAPSWARTDSESYSQRYQSDRYDGGGYGDRRDGRSDRRRPRERGQEDGSRSFRRDRPPRRDDRRPSDPRDPGRRDNRRDREASVVEGVPPPRSLGPRPQGDRPQGDRPFRPRPEGGYGDRRPRETVKPLDANIRLLPDQKTLGTIMRRIQTNHHAYPLRNLVGLFLDNPASCLVRFESKKENPVTFCQCKRCGFVALSEGEVTNHIFSHHFDESFDVENITCDPPSGAFSCVAKCGISGEWLGAVNHHSYNRRVAEMLNRYSNMSEEAYRARIEMVRDPEAIEAWRQTLCQKQVYRLKQETPPAPEPTAEAPANPAEEGEAAAEEPAEKTEASANPGMARDTAEMLFKREILPNFIMSANQATCTVAIGLKTTSLPLLFLLRDTLVSERRYPGSLFFALRGAFRHRKFKLFRVNEPRGPEFVMSREPVALAKEHAVEELRKAVTYVEEHPCCTRHDLMVAMAQGLDEAAVQALASQIVWLFEKGHLVEYYNGVLCAPMEPLKFRYLPGEKGAGKADSAKALEVAPTPEVKTDEAKPAADVPESAPASGDSITTETDLADAEPKAVPPSVSEIPAPAMEPPTPVIEPAPEAACPLAAAEDNPPVATSAPVSGDSITTETNLMDAEPKAEPPVVNDGPVPEMEPPTPIIEPPAADTEEKPLETE